MATQRMQPLPSIQLPTPKLDVPMTGLAGTNSNKKSKIPEMMSYARLLRDRNEYRTAGTRSGSDFNIFDTPSLKFFKILFYFEGKSEFETESRQSTGLLAPAWNYYLSDNTYYNSTTAWAYLKMNDENERAEKLQQFITLLSNINSESPWYFSSISGLDSAMERKSASDGKLDMNETKKIQIKCIPDAVDDRIGTLLSLYRDIVWSWSMKKEILPVNLRKFDMAVYIFESPMHYIHKDSDVIDGKSGFKPSYKMLEFHNCEFDYNSIKSGYSEISNQTGVQPTYTIDITYDDCYEVSYNSIMMRTIGDVIATDTAYMCMLNGDNVSNVESKPQEDDINIINELKGRMTHSFTKTDEEEPVKSNKFVSNAVKQIVGAIKGDVSRIVKSAILGNIYTYSLTKIGSELDSLSQGNLIKAGQSVKQYIKSAQERAAIRNYGNKKPNGNIFSDDVSTKKHIIRDIYPDTIEEREEPNGNIYPDEVSTKKHIIRDIYPNYIPSRGKPTGNIFNKATIANN